MAVKVLLSISFAVIFRIIAIGQTTEESPPTKSPSSLIGLSISGHAYPISAIGDVHKSFMVQYGISKSTQFELQGFYDTYLLTERFRSSLIGKVYLNEKLYLLSGVEVEVATEDAGKVAVPYRLGFVAGSGYDISDNFMIEAKRNVQLNNSNIGAFGETLVKMPAVYTIGSKWKF